MSPEPIRVAVLYLWPVEDVTRVALRALIGKQLDAYREEGSGRWLVSREAISDALKASDPQNASAWERYFEESGSNEVLIPCWACTPVSRPTPITEAA